MTQKFLMIIAILVQLMPKKLVYMFDTAKVIQNLTVSTTEGHEISDISGN